MARQFTCPNCEAQIQVRFLKPGETCECKNCFEKCIVPEDCESVDEASTASPAAAGYTDEEDCTSITAEGCNERSGADQLASSSGPAYWGFMIAAYILFKLLSN